MKTAFVIAGLDIHETAAERRYQLLREAIGEKGYKIVAVNISWRQTTPTQYVKQFINLYHRHLFGQ